MLLGTSLALTALSFANSALGFQASNRALVVAISGALDAELQLTRNKDFSDAGYCVPAANLPCPAGSATVIVTQNSPTTGQVTVTSDATAARRRRKVQMIFSVGSLTTEVDRVSFQVLSL